MKSQNYFFITESLPNNLQFATLVNPFFSFTFKNCKGASLFDFVRYFISYFSSNIFNGLNPKMRRIDV